MDLFHTVEVISDDSLRVLQWFVVLMYDSKYDCDNVNVARKKLFSSKAKSIGNVPPTVDAVLQHIQRAVFQAGHIWSQSLVYHHSYQVQATVAGTWLIKTGYQFG